MSYSSKPSQVSSPENDGLVVKALALHSVDLSLNSAVDFLFVIILKIEQKMKSNPISAHTDKIQTLLAVM